MKKGRILSLVLGLTLCLGTLVGLTACKRHKPTPVNVVAKDVYAMSALSSVSYLKSKEELQSFVARAEETLEPAASRPALVTEEDLNGVKSCLGLFDQILTNNGVNQSTVKNDMTEGDLAQYNFVMSITMTTLGSSETYKLYYNEIETTTEREIEDEEEEVEVSTTLAGVLVAGETSYRVEGVREFETQGDETEATIEFKTYLDNNNYIIVEQSVEQNEIEYEYKIYENGVKVQDIELELEKEDGKTVVEYELKDLSTGVKNKTEYKVTLNQDGTFSVKLKKNGQKEKFKVAEGATVLVITYENGFVEEI